MNTTPSQQATTPPPGRPKAGFAPSGGSAERAAASMGATTPPPGRPKAGFAPSGGSAARAAASVGATTPPPGRPKAGFAPSGGQRSTRSGKRGGHSLHGHPAGDGVDGVVAADVFDEDQHLLALKKRTAMY